ncbi:hypothetical protein K0040_11890 [Terrisporobacter petrolearius]|nr:hypothetical protein [Terrisporobacter petrolearius]
MAEKTWMEGEQIMDIYGYKKDEDEEILELNEVCFYCNNKWELNKIIEFLNYVKNEYNNMPKEVTGDCHIHYQDWDRKWKHDSPDIIITLNLDNK